MDTSAAFALLSRLPADGLRRRFTLRAMAADEERLIELVRSSMHVAPVRARSSARASSRSRLDDRDVAGQLARHTGFIGEVAVQAVRSRAGPRSSASGKRRRSSSRGGRCDSDRGLVTFLIGVVFAYLLGVQAQPYGATIFVVDGVGMAICRELSPILVAVDRRRPVGRGIHRPDRLDEGPGGDRCDQTLGLSPIQVLVIPRLVAIVVGLPLLVFVGDLAGIGGGVLIGALQLGISPPSFVSRLHAVLPVSALVIGIAKAPAFAAFIAMIACRMGMSVERDARSVGEHTTSTVVQSIVWVIVLDAMFAVTLQRLGM